MKIPDRALESLLLLAFTSCTQDDGGEESPGENAAIVGQWRLSSVYIHETGETHAHPQVLEDPDSGCTVTTTQQLDIEPNLEGFVSIIVDSSGCDDPGYDGSHVPVMEHLVAEEAEPGTWNITIHGDEGPLVFACELDQQELLCEREFRLETWGRVG